MKEVLNIDTIQDGSEFNDSLVRKYELFGNDFRYSYSNIKHRNVYHSNFVGIVRSLKDNSILFSMPKHYMKINDFNQLSKKEKLGHIRRVIKSIDRCIEETRYTQYKHSKDVKGSLSFEAYDVIYNYYQTYGLYRSRKGYFKKGYGNHINWKKTISKSNKYILDNKLVINPLIIKKRQQLTNLITECMIFTFNYTELMYGQFIELPNTEEVRHFGINQYILNNIDGAIYRLLQMKAKIFKDSENYLIDNLILFLKQVNSVPNKSKQNIKDYSYETVWEKAVENYLNTYFTGVRYDKLVYAENPVKRYQFKKYIARYDKQHVNNHLDPDHYYFDDKTKQLYIFDSKYYVKLDSLNHKQLVYHFLIKNQVRAKEIYDALIVPTEGENKTDIHVEILPTFLRDDEQLTIYLHKLNIESVILEFIS